MTGTPGTVPGIIPHGMGWLRVPVGNIVERDPEDADTIHFVPWWKYCYQASSVLLENVTSCYSMNLNNNYVVWEPTLQKLCWTTFSPHALNIRARFHVSLFIDDLVFISKYQLSCNMKTTRYRNYFPFKQPAFFPSTEKNSAISCRAIFQIFRCYRYILRVTLWRFTRPVEGTCIPVSEPQPRNSTYCNLLAQWLQ